MRILVTGSTSQTGSLAVRALVREGHDVRCLSRGEKSIRYLPLSDIQLVKGDLEDPESLARALEGIDAVVQIAHLRFAPASIPVFERAGVRRALFFSSTRRFTEFDCVSARQVIEGERVIESSRLDFTILRPSMIYGSRRDHNVARVMAHLRRHRVFPLIGGGRNLVQPVFVLDLVDALLAAIRRPEAVRKAYTIAGPEAITYRRQIEMIANAVGRKVFFLPVPITPMLWAAKCAEAVLPKPYLTTEQVRRMAEDRAFDISDARRDLGFAPRPFEDGVRSEAAGEIDAIWDETEKQRGSPEA
jgi:nucleoside-diphosphate-sugar epimerase